MALEEVKAVMFQGRGRLEQTAIREAQAKVCEQQVALRDPRLGCQSSTWPQQRAAKSQQSTVSLPSTSKLHRLD